MTRKRPPLPNSNGDRPTGGTAVDDVAVPAGKLLGRTETARMIGVSKTTFRRRLEGTALTPEVGPDGVHRFREEHVRELVIQRNSGAAPDGYDGATAPEVFGLLDDALHPV